MVISADLERRGYPAFKRHSSAPAAPECIRAFAAATLTNCKGRAS